MRPRLRVRRRVVRSRRAVKVVVVVQDPRDYNRERLPAYPGHL